MTDQYRHRSSQAGYDDLDDDNDHGKRRREQDACRRKELDEALERGLEDTFPVPTRFRSLNRPQARTTRAIPRFCGPVMVNPALVCPVRMSNIS